MTGRAFPCCLAIVSNCCINSRSALPRSILNHLRASHCSAFGLGAVSHHQLFLQLLAGTSSGLQTAPCFLMPIWEGAGSTPGHLPMGGPVLGLSARLARRLFSASRFGTGFSHSSFPDWLSKRSLEIIPESLRRVLRSFLHYSFACL